MLGYYDTWEGAYVMFLGFDETCSHIENIWETVPPVVKLLVLPYIIVVWMVSVFVSVFLWILGYWRCHDCDRVYSAFTKKHKEYWLTGWDSGGIDKYCPNCVEEEEEIV
jgi:hypothetical protein